MFVAHICTTGAFTQTFCEPTLFNFQSVLEMEVDFLKLLIFIQPVGLLMEAPILIIPYTHKIVFIICESTDWSELGMLQ